MYDAELFGHWWFEWPDFINFLFRKMQYDQNIIKPITPCEYLNKFPVNQIARRAASWWGDKGYYEVWLIGSNDYIYRHLHKASDRMSELANKFSRVSGILKRALNQSARELLLAQSSDWAFIMTTGTMVEYAKKRTKDHLGARIISAIDAYDAMTSDRPYRKALGKEYAISELEKGMGTQFDPEVDKAFINILKSNIGNLEEITLRALRILKDCDLIGCEDTRQSLKLLSHFGISKPLISFYSYNQQYRVGQIIDKLFDGKNVALISDAGAPCISDPGYILIKEAVERGIKTE
jgi:hypothetical protein